MFIPNLEIPVRREWIQTKMPLISQTRNQAALARTLGISPSQLNRWLGESHEEIPGSYLFQISQILGQEEARLAPYYNQCADCQKKLVASTKKLARKIGMDENLLYLKLANLALVLIQKEDHLDQWEVLLRISEFLSVAAHCVDQARKSFLSEQKCFTPDNVDLHLKYPYNRFFGFLVDLDHHVRATGSSDKNGILDLRTSLLDSMREISKSRIRNKRSCYCVQHSVHMLARHGTDDDQEYIEYYLKSQEVEVRRMALFGLFLRQQSNSEFVDKVVYEIANDHELSQTVVGFDLVHYGDSIAVQPPSAHKLGITNSLTQIVRGIQTSQSNSLRELSSLRLNLLLDQSNCPPHSIPERVWKSLKLLEDNSSEFCEESPQFESLLNLSLIHI